MEWLADVSTSADVSMYRRAMGTSNFELNFGMIRPWPNILLITRLDTPLLTQEDVALPFQIQSP